MIIPNKSQKSATVKCLVALPAMAITFIVFSSSIYITTEKFDRMEAVEISLKKDTLPADNDEIFKVVEEMPRFPGCEHIDGTAKEKEECAKERMLNFIYKNLAYPEVAREEEIDGMVVIQFIIAKDGSINKGRIVRNLGGGCGEEALRVVNSMPDFRPGCQRGKKINLLYTLPVRFKLEDDDWDYFADYRQKDEVYDEPKDKIIDILDVYDTKSVDVMPRFPGCEHINQTDERKECAQKAMLNFIYKNIEYPVDARIKGKEGIVVVTMIVKSDGRIENAEVFRGVSYDIDEESLRVINSMPAWIPGISREENVDVKVTIPIRFKLG